MEELDSVFQITEKPVNLPLEVLTGSLTEDITDLYLVITGLKNANEAERRNEIQQQRVFLTSLLQVIDALDRSLQLPTQPAANDLTLVYERQRKNIESIRRLMLQQLEKQDVHRIDVQKGLVDSTTTDIEEYEVVTDVPAETVLRETLGGYTWQNKVLRRARVVAAEEAMNPL